MPRHKHTRRARAQQGFTLVEIIAALGVMTVASMAIIALQGHTMRANMHARQLATGMQIAQMWIERFKQDAQRWNQAADPSDNDPSAATVIGDPNTEYLNAVLTSGAVFQAIPNPVLDDPNSPIPFMSNGYDYQGQPIDWSVADQAGALHYCVSFRPTWVIIGRLLRTDVRVWWPRESANDAAAARASMAPYVASECDDDDVSLSPGGSANPNYHFVYLSTVIGVTEVTR